MISFRLAVDNVYNKDAKTLFIACVAFGKTADVITRYVSKGDPLLVEGSLEPNEYTDKDGVERSTIQLTVQACRLAGHKGDSPARPQASAKVDAAPENDAPEIAYDGDIPF